MSNSYSNYNHHVSYPAAHNLILASELPTELPLWDTGATDLFFRSSDSNLLSSISSGGGLRVGLPNGHAIASTATGVLPTSFVSPDAHIFPDNLLNRSLVGVAEYCNNGCTMIFTATSSTCIHDATGTIISQTPKAPTAKLWPMNLAPITSSTIANVVRHEINADFVAFSHASFFSPCDSALYSALLKGYLGNFPKLTAKMLNSDRPNSIATAKGHLKQKKQKPRTAKKSQPTPSLATINSPAEEEDEIKYANSIAIKVLRCKDNINYSDMPGRFPFTSHLGHEYMLLSIYRGYIHVELMKCREGAELVKAYRATYSFFARLTDQPNLQMLDNETSTALNEYLRNEAKVTVELVPPNCHRRNRAERAIQDWKAHFIAGLATVDPNFPIAAWSELVPQASLTINHIRAYTMNRSISAYEGMHGKKYDFVAHPIYPPGVRVVVLEPTDKRESWAPHGLEGFYLGPAPDTYQSYRCWILSTNGIRTSDSISVHPHKLKLPGSFREDLVYAKATDILSALAIFKGTPEDSATLSLLAKDMHALVNNHIPGPVQRVSPESTAEQRVSPESTAEQRVPMQVSPPVPSSPDAPSVHPTESRARTRAKAVSNKKKGKATLPAATQYIRVPKSKQRAKDRVFHTYVGRCYTDLDDGTKFQIQSIVFPANVKKDKFFVPFYKYYDMDLHTKPPTHETDFEHTPCDEMIRWDRKTKTYCKPAYYIRWSNDHSASSIISNYATHGERHMAHSLARQNAPSIKRKHAKPPSSYAFSTYHSSPTDKPLNVTPDGKPLTHRNAIRGPDSAAWLIEDANEFRRLISTNTMRPIFKHDKPRGKHASYYNPQVKEKLDSNGEKTRRTRGTLGGDRCNYDGPTSSPVADITVIKLHLQSVVSDRRNHGTDTRYATIDIKDFYLGSKLAEPEYVSIAIKNIPSDTMMEFDLHQYADGGHILFQVDGTMYGHPVAGRIANADLVEHLCQHGYIQDPNIPSLFENATNNVSFTLVVDDFGIKYTSAAALQDLVRILELKYKISIDISGQKYVGIRLAWDYAANTVTMDMPTTVPDAVARFLPKGPRRKAKSPGIYIPPNYMSPDMGATVDESPPVTPAEKLFIMEVVGVFLFYARMVDCTLLPVVTFISKKQAKPTKNTLEATYQLLDYAASHPNHKVTYRACDMQLRVQSDGSHLSQEKAGSIAGGIHYCTDTDDDPQVINGAILALCSTITTVCGSASETEYASLYTNGQHAYFERTILAALHYPQQPTTIYADNIAAVGVANDTVKLRKSKSYDMRYHWIRDRTRRKIFTVIWAAGATNDADFFTKIQPSTRHQYFAGRFVHT